MTEDADYPRTIYEAKLDACYYALLYTLHERLFARVDKGSKLIELIAGSGGFYAVTVGHDGLTKVFTLLVAIVALTSLVFDFAGRARETHNAMTRYMALLANSDEMTVEGFDKELARIAIDTPTVIDGLRKPAFNQNVISHGRQSYALLLNGWEKFLQAIA